MARLNIDLEPLVGIMDVGSALPRSLVKHALAAESAGAHGVMISTGDGFDNFRRKSISLLSETLQSNLTVKTDPGPQWIETLLELKPSMVIFRQRGDMHAMRSDTITRFQVENILVGFEMTPDLELVKIAARLKSDFVLFDCQDYGKARSLGDRIAELNRIARAAALGAKLSLGIGASCNFSLLRLSKLAEMRSVEEFFIGLPFFEDALIHGYEKTTKSIFSIIS